MALVSPEAFAQRQRPTLGELLQDVAAALRAHVAAQRLGPHVEGNVLRALSTDGRLLESEDSAALAALVMLAAEASGGLSEQAVPVAVAMECLMSAADILDDIQDDDLDAKGWESAAVAAETVAALLVLSHGAIADSAATAGDPLGLVRAQRLLAKFEAQALRGQSEDVRRRGSTLSGNDILEITRAKSGSLGRCAAEIGACLGTTDENMIRHFGDFGEHLAVVFQLMNDIAGVWPGHEANDLQRQSPTPLAGFLNANKETDATNDAPVVAVAPPEQEPAAPNNEVLESGAVQFTWALATVELARARRKAHLIATFKPSSRLAVLLQR